jgi:hypothetical protein
MAMHSMLIAKAIAGMAAQTTLEEFSVASGISGRSVAMDVAELLLATGIGRSDGAMLYFSGRDRVKTAMLAIHAGCDPEEVSASLTWKDFEDLASQVLVSLGYRTRTNVRFTKPRMEIDVIGVDGNFAVALDCKHWKRSSISMISTCCTRQAARVRELVKREHGLARVVPAVLTLHEGGAASVGRVPVVPVAKFGSFLSDVKSFLPELCVVTRQGPA